MSDLTPRTYGFGEHETDQARRWAQLTPLERLRLLQQAKEFCNRWLGAARPTPPEPPEHSQMHGWEASDRHHGG